MRETEDTQPDSYFGNGKEALKYFFTTRDKPFLILCDVNIPLMNGLELRKIINENQQLRKKAIPFVFPSTTARPTEVNRAYEMTIQGFFKREKIIIRSIDVLN